jgi:hypothetical protein
MATVERLLVALEYEESDEIENLVWLHLLYVVHRKYVSVTGCLSQMICLLVRRPVRVQLFSFLCLS